MRSLTLTGVTKVAVAAVLAATFVACTQVPLAADYRRPDVLPAGSPFDEPGASAPVAVSGDQELRERARFVVRRVEVESLTERGGTIEFEYYDVDGEMRKPVIVMLPIFTGVPVIPRFFARYFANQGWAAIVVLRTRDPLDALVAPEGTAQSNLKDYQRILDWVEQEAELDVSRVGLFGVSLGAMDAVMLAAVDRRIDALVVAMAGGDLSDVLASTNYRPVVRSLHELAEQQGTTREVLSAELDARTAMDLLAMARYVDAERVLMITTRTDAIVPFEAQQRLRASLGSPETLQLPTGHRPSVLLFPKVRNAAFEFFARQFGIEHVALTMN